MSTVETEVTSSAQIESPVDSGKTDRLCVEEHLLSQQMLFYFFIRT